MYLSCRLFLENLHETKIQKKIAAAADQKKYKQT